jgi:hypothetical protein
MLRIVAPIGWPVMTGETGPFHSKPCYERDAFRRASATRALNRIQYPERSWRLGFHEARARFRQYSSAHWSSDLFICSMAASTRARSLAARTARVLLQAQGDFPQPVHSPFCRRALFFRYEGDSAITSQKYSRRNLHVDETKAIALIEGF